MDERYINLRPWEVRAFLAGRKTRLTRVVKGTPECGPGGEWWDASTGSMIRCPFCVPGDTLIGREKWRPSHVVGKVWYAEICGDETHERWRSAVHMPRWACRIRLHVEAVRVERLHDITEEEAIAEGMTPRPHEPYDCFDDPRVQYEWQWNEDNKRHPWASSPWTWVGTVRVEVARG